MTIISILEEKLVGRRVDIIKTGNDDPRPGRIVGGSRVVGKVFKVELIDGGAVLISSIDEGVTYQTAVSESDIFALVLGGK